MPRCLAKLFYHGSSPIADMLVIVALWKFILLLVVFREGFSLHIISMVKLCQSNPPVIEIGMGAGHVLESFITL